MSRKALFSTTAALLLIGVPALAQNVNVNSSNANSSSSTSSQSQSTSGAAANNATGNAQNITFNTPATPANTTSTTNINDRVSGGTNNTNTSSGYTTSDNIVRTTPTVYAPPVSGGNPCTLAVSGGVSVIGWGAAAGGTFVDQDCANRQKIAMIWNAGYKGTAKELMCNDRDTYFAFRTAGEPCAFRPQFEGNQPPPAQPPMVQTQPVPIGPPAVAPAPMVQRAVPKQYPRCDARRGIVDNCVSG